MPPISELQRLSQIHIAPLIERFRSESCAKSPTFQYWDFFLCAVQVMLTIIWAERLGDWNLSLQSQCQMLPYIFQTDRMNYSRWLPVYLLEMIQLPEDLKLVLSSNFSFHEKSGKFNGIWLDMGMEKTIIRDSKGQGGIGGLTQQRSALIRWTLTRRILGSYASVMRTRSGLSSDDNVHNIHDEPKPTAMARDEQHVTTLTKHIKECMTHPFHTEAHPDILVNISSAFKQISWSRNHC